MSKFKAMPPFDENPHLWDRFLAANQLSDDELLRTFSVSQEFLATHSSGASRWTEDLEEALASPTWEGPKLTWSTSLGPQGALLTFARPLIVWALRRIHQGLISIEPTTGLALITREDLVSLFLRPLAGAAYAMSYKALVLELNVSRLREELTGDTPEERFEAFSARLEAVTNTRPLYEEYAVLSRMMVEGLRTIADFCQDFLRHLAQDWTTLQETFFNSGDLSQLVGVAMSGDSHRGGRRVLILEFAGGHKLIYKPHSLRLDEHFQVLLRWLNDHGQHPPFRTMTCLDCGDHGWTEFIPMSDCSTEGEIQRFYRRQGSLLAVLYAMLATDFHHENLIASGENPLLIDLESLFHPTLRPSEESQLEEAVRGALNYSVLRTALLPSRQLVGKNDTAFDIGGLSDVEGQESPYASPFVDMSVADEAHIDRLRRRMPGSQNVPTLMGKKPDPSSYTEEIVDGFTSMYRLLLANREALLATDGPIYRFAGAEVRFIFRHTRTYAVLSGETYHPDLQRNALDRDRHFLRLWYLLEERQDIARLIISELDALWKGDVPFFYSRTDSVDLFDHRDQRHPALLAVSCLDEVVDHISGLNEEDLKRQVWFIRGAMACQKIQPGHLSAGGMGNSFQQISGTDRPSQDVFLQEARRVGDRLIELALRGRGDAGEEATWLGLVLLNETVWRILPLGIDLYNGLGGIILFLAYLSKATGDDQYSDLARAALITARRQQRNIESSLTMTGAFTGWGSLVYLYTHLYALWSDPRLLGEALDCAKQTGVYATKDENYEVMYGNAGAILALKGLYEIHPSPEVLDSMQQCGQHILAQACPMAEGAGWAPKALNCVPLAGYSHGASGIASALEILFRHTGKVEYLQGACSALSYERSLFSEEQGNWMDMRGHHLEPKEGDEQPSINYPVAWCNGAPGIGLSRFRMPSLENAIARAEVDAALATTRSRGFGYTHSLCHGDLGNLELFLEARKAGWPPLEAGEVERYASGILSGIQQQGWICGTPRGIETPGLMTGLAGVGYGFLRLYDPESTPSVLLLDSPAESNRAGGDGIDQRST